MCDSSCDHPTRRQVLARGALLVPAIAISSAFGRTSSNPTPVKPINVANGLNIFPRPAWATSAQPAGILRPETSVKFLLVHHTAGTTNYKLEQVPNQIRQIYNFHTSKAKGWADVCYNFFVDRFGQVWEGRQGSIYSAVMADATGGSQGFAQLVCLLGNFDTTSPTVEMMESCAATLAWLATKNKINVNQTKTVSFTSRGSNKWKSGVTVNARPISGHRDMSATVCPGKFVYPLLEKSLPARVSELQKFQNAKP